MNRVNTNSYNKASALGFYDYGCFEDELERPRQAAGFINRPLAQVRTDEILPWLVSNSWTPYKVKP